MNYCWIATEFFMSGVEFWLLYFLCSKLMNINKRFKWYIVFLAGFCAAIIITFATHISPFAVWKTMLSIALIIAFVFLFFGDDWKDKALSVVLYYATLAIADILGTTLITIVRNNLSWAPVLLPSVDRLVMFCVAKLIMALVFYIIIYFRSQEKDQLPSKYWFLFLFLFSTLLCIILLFASDGFSEHTTGNYNNIILLIIMAMLLIYLSMYYLFYQTSKNFSKMNEMSMIAFQNETIEKYFLQSREYNRMVKILSHDLRHNLCTWKELSEDKNYCNVLQDIREYEQKIEEFNLVDVQHDVANAIINQKMLVARKHDIRFEVKGTFGKELALSKIDLCSLLANIIDNAIEATLKIQNSTIKQISMVVKREGPFLLIETENNYAIKPVLRNDRFITCKENRLDHGIGMISIEHVVNKYDGVMKYSYKDNVFKMNMMLKAYEKIPT